MSATSKHRVLLIGCGAVSKILYIPGLGQLAARGRLEVAGVVDPDLRRAETLAASFPGARSYAKLASALEEPGLSLAIVAAPHCLHEEIVLQCLDRDLAVLCEKPMAMTGLECDRMIDRARQGGRPLAIGHFRRFFPSCRALRAIIKEGVLGPLRTFRILEGETYSWPAVSASFFSRQSAGGGVLIDAGVHTLDLLLWWMGDVTDLAYKDDALGGVEANCHLGMRMESGVEGTVQLSRDWPLPNRYDFDFEKGRITYCCDVIDRLDWRIPSGDPEIEGALRRIMDRENGAVSPSFLDCFIRQLENVLDAAEGAAELVVPATEGRKAIDLIEKCYAQRTCLDMPWLDPVERKEALELHG